MIPSCNQLRHFAFLPYLVTLIIQEVFIMTRRIKALTLLSVPLMLAACDGYEWQLTNTHFPYGNQRTAGSGVIYVLAKMMPEKSLNLQPAEREMQAPAIQPAQGGEMDKVFNDTQNK